jgi:hypothetical protein
VRAGPSTWRGLRFAALDLTLTGLRLGAAPRDISGHIDGVEFPDVAGATVRATSIELSGPASTPDVRVLLGLADFSALVGRALPAGLGNAGARITLAAPDGVRIATPSGEATARIVLRPDGGLDLVVTTPGAGSVPVTLLAPGGPLPVRLSGVAVDGDRLVLSGSVDARSLGL